MATARREKPVFESRPAGAHRGAADRHPARPKGGDRSVRARLRRADGQPTQHCRTLVVGTGMGRRTRSNHRLARQNSQSRCGLLMYLVDTNVVSEARRGTAEAVKWLRSVNPLDVHLSVITLG